MRRALVAILATAMLAGSVPIAAAEGATGSAVGRVTVLRKGMPGTAEPSWKVRFTSQEGGAAPIEVPLNEGIYETPELPVGPYQVQVVDAFGQPVGASQSIVLSEGATRVDLRLELARAEAGAPGEDRSNWKVWAIVGGAAAALALAAGGGDGSDSPASPAN